MIAYAYDNQGYFIGTTQLQESPLEPGVYFEKPNTTIEVTPALIENTIPFWTGLKWELKPDYSGREYWNIETKESKYFERGEEKPNNYTDKKPPIEPYYVFLNNEWVIDPIKLREYRLEQCKNKAKYLLANSDWSTLPDVQTQLENYNDFVAYRSQLRELVINPVEEPVFPTEPEAKWK